MRTKVNATVRIVKDILPDVLNEEKKLNGRKVKVGVFDGEMQFLAAIHEYGCEIHAVNSKYLTVPLIPAAKGKRAAEFTDLFVYTAKSGEKFLARRKGKGLELVYWLTPSVVIPERSFIRSGFDENVDDVIRLSEALLNKVADGSMTSDEYLDMIGQQLSSKIKTFARNLSDPPNAPITKNVKGSSNPLVDTGQLVNSIDWRVE